MKFDSVQIFVDGIEALFGAIFLVLGKTIEGLWKSRFLFSIIIFILLWFVFPNWYKENALWGNLILIASVVIPLITWVVTGVKKNKEKRECDQALESALEDVTKLRNQLIDANISIVKLKNGYKQIADEYRILEKKYRLLEEEKRSQEQAKARSNSQSNGIPRCFYLLYFKEIPKNVNEVRNRYIEMAKLIHPDAKGNEELCKELNNAYDECMKYYK